MSSPLAVTQGAAAAIAVVSLLAWLSPSLLSYVALIPSNTLTVHAYVWNLATAGLVDSNPLIGVASAGIVLWGVRVERQWGDATMAKFLAATTVATSIAVFAATFAALVLGTEGAFYMHYCGGVGVASSVLVAMKQLFPDNEIYPGVPLRVKWLPLAAVVLSVAAELVSPTHIPTDAELGEGRATLRGTHVLPTTFATFIAWVYLRFFQSNKTSLAVQQGDASRAFAFKTFFPEALQSPVGVAADAIFKVVNAIFCGFGNAIIEAEAEAKRREEEDQSLFGTAASSTVVDMRRQVALSALADRLEKAKEADPGAGLDCFDIETGASAPPEAKKDAKPADLSV